jgi:hypothetical protein
MALTGKMSCPTLLWTLHIEASHYVGAFPARLAIRIGSLEIDLATLYFQKVFTCDIFSFKLGLHITEFRVWPSVINFSHVLGFAERE